MISTTGIFDVISRMYVLCHDEIAWPTHPTTSEPPLVVLGGLGLDEALEPIIVSPTPSDQSDIDFATMGSTVGHDEHFGIRVALCSWVPGTSGVECVERLHTLSTTFEQAIRDPTTGKPAGGFHDLGFQVPWWRLAKPALQVWQAPEGVIGQVLHDVAFFCRL